MSETETYPVPTTPKAGVTPKRIRHRKAIEKADLYLAKKLPHHLKKLEELANGVLVMKEDRDGEEVIYRIPPDRQALEFLIERGAGKTASREELMEGEAQGPIGYIPFIPASEYEKLKGPE
jgi:hypothetical protein